MRKLFVRKNIPNFLTLFRIALAIVVFILVSYDWGPVVYKIYWFNNGNGNKHEYNDFYLSALLAAIFFSLASITDFLDGYLARKYKWVSSFGKLWDPIADKILVNGVVIFLACQRVIPDWIAVVLVCRDIIVDAVRMIGLEQGKIISANIYGKIKTMALMVGLAFILFVSFVPEPQSLSGTPILKWYLLQNGLMVLATLMSVISGFIYLHKFFKTK